MTLAEELSAVDAHLMAWTDHPNEELRGVIRHLIDGGGRRIRPTLTILCAHAAANGRSAVDDFHPSRVYQAAAAVELLHVGTLYHDDVLDEAEERRGIVSCNKNWTNTLAILGGDYLLAASTELASGLGQWHAQVISSALRAICDGQIEESFALYDIGRTEEEYFASITGKTAALFSAACALGAFEGSCGKRLVTDRLASYGRKLGMAFQIVDDILDMVGDRRKTGKPVGMDIVNGVYTLPMIYAFQDGIEMDDLVQNSAGGAMITKVELDKVRSGGALKRSLAVAELLWKEACEEAGQYLSSVPEYELNLASIGADLIASVENDC